MPNFGYPSSDRLASELPPPPPSLCVPQRPTPEPPDASRLLSLVADALTRCGEAGMDVKLNIMLGQYLVKQAVRKLRLPRTISWFVVPHAGPLAGGLAEDLIVYYCIDRK